MAEVRVQSAIPDKKYFTIGEVSALCHVKPHVLRYWEQEFPQLRPAKRRGNRRYYRRQDINLIEKIRELLYLQGYTINGARSVLNGQSNFQTVVAPVAIENEQEKVVAEFIDKQESMPQQSLLDLEESHSSDDNLSSRTGAVVNDMLRDLERLLGQLTETEI